MTSGVVADDKAVQDGRPYGVAAVSCLAAQLTPSLNFPSL
jgi:hypothetical protein